MDQKYRVAADIGGTFTDIALIREDGSIATRKVLSTPDDYGRAVVDGIKQLLEGENIPIGAVGEILHGCTVATNAIIEGKGAKTALITTKGFRDVLEMRRIRVPRLYDTLYVKPEPLVPRNLRMEVSERIGAAGEVLKPLDRAGVMRAIETIKRDDVQAVAVTFINSYANPDHERQVGAILRKELPDTFLSLSVDILPEIREYERTSTTVINSYLGPPVRRYLQSLIDQLAAAGSQGRLLVMQSSGGILDAEDILERPAQIVECGPAAGVIAAAHVARLIDCPNVITLDMGGTTAKASIIEEGRILRTDEYEVGGGISLSNRLVRGGGYALKLPVIDISEVGAGGGSIVWLDKGGSLKVGPQSAGAAPGPVCYDLGGEEPTVTDANVVLGYLNPDALANGTVPINSPKARAVIEQTVAKPLGQGIMEAAFGVHMIASANMMRAVKAVSTYRGRDPRDFALFAFGGSGGVHAVEMARSLEIKRVIVPPAAGVFSAMGLLFSDISTGLSQAFLRKIEDVDPKDMTQAYEELEQRVLGLFHYPPEQVALHRFAEMRYAGQAFELPVTAPDGTLDADAVGDLADAFEQEHQRTYGHSFSRKMPIQTVGLRVTGTVAPQGRTDIAPAAAEQTGEGGVADRPRRKAYYGARLGVVETPIVRRPDLAGDWHEGPFIVEDYEGTVVIPPESKAKLDELGDIVIEVGAAG